VSVVSHTVGTAERDGNSAPVNSVQNVKRAHRQPKRTARTDRIKPLVASVRGAICSGIIQGELARTLDQWATAWGVPELPNRITLRFNPRLRSTVARWVITSHSLEVGSRFYARRSDSREVLCHEFAHAAAVSKHGRAAQPHGPEWQRLVREAGYEPKAYRRKDRLPRFIRGQAVGLLSYEHRCLVCQSVRYGKKAVQQWRCPECSAAGLSGKLVITRVPDPGILQ